MPKKLSKKYEEVELVYRNRKKVSDRIRIRDAQEAYDILKENWDFNKINLQEEFKILLLDNRMGLMSISPISKGGLSGTVVDAKIVFATALKRRANRIIMAHNHPSGSLEPSKQDLQLTQTFIRAGNFLQLPIEDHIVITQEGYCSLITDYADELAF